MADMREINDRLDEIEAHLWWRLWQDGREIPPPLGAGSRLGRTLPRLGGLSGTDVDSQPQ